MKATSKLISVVLILAMCLSLFTVSAFADNSVIIGGAIEPGQAGGIPARNSWVGANRVQQAAEQPAVIEGDSYQGSGATEPVTAADTAQAVPGTAEQATNTVPAVVTVSTAAELAAAAAKGGEIKLANDIAMSEGLTLASNTVIDLNGKALSFVNDAAAKGMAITGMGATIKNGMVSAKGSVLSSGNGTVEVGFGSVASGVTLNNVNVRFYAPADWTMFGQGVGLVYGTYNRDVSAYFAGSDKLEVVEQNGVYTVRDKVEVPEAAPTVTENADAAVAETEQSAAETTEETGTETEQTDAAVEEPAAEGEQPDAENTEAEVEVEGEDAAAEGEDADAEGEDAAAEGEDANAEGEDAAAEGEDAAAEGEDANAEGEDAAAEGEDANAEGEDAATEGEDANAEGEDAAAEGEQADENALPESNEQQAEENPADDEPADETPVNIVEEEEKVYEEEVRTDIDAEEDKNDVVTLTGTDPVTGAVVVISGKNLPEGLTVVVKPLSTDVIGGLRADEEAVLALDISLVDAEGNEYEPKDDPNVGAVSVQIQHPSLGNLEEDESLALYHVVDDVVQTVGSAAQSAEGTLDFATGSFSPFIITKTTGDGTANTGSDGETHKKTIKITNWSGDIYVKGDVTDTNRLVFEIQGGVIPESISVVDPDYVSSGNAEIYRAGYMLYNDPTLHALDINGYDYSFNTKPDGTGTPVNPGADTIPDPVYVIFNKYGLDNAPKGKWAFVFWFRDTTDTTAQRVYMVQYVTIAPEPVILPVYGEGGNGITKDGFGGYYFNKCSYNPMEFYLTAELDYFSIVDSATLSLAAQYVWPNTFVTVWDKYGNSKNYNFNEMLDVSDYITEDPVTHEFIAGKSLKILSNLLKKLDFKDYDIHIEQVNHNTYGTTKIPNPATYDIRVSLKPGITVADGLNDYIKGKNVWIKFESCWPIDYDENGKLCIWIGGQQISKDYYSISNDHQTLWIYRNLLDQLRSNNSYTLTARLWRLSPKDGTKETFYPASTSFNILAAGSTSYKSPKTGDNSNVALWAAVAVLSGGAVVALIPKKKKVKINK